MQFVEVTKAALTSNVVTLTVATLDGLRAGYHTVVQGVDTIAQPHFDGNHILTGTATTVVNGADVYTVTYAKNHANIASFDCAGRITPVCTWVVAADVELFLGVAPATPEDADYLDACVEAGNDWAYRRRQAAGYDDWANALPSADVKLGTVLYAAGLYRERGSIDSFQSFADMAPLAPIGTNAQVLRLLGLNKPKVA